MFVVLCLKQEFLEVTRYPVSKSKEAMTEITKASLRLALYEGYKLWSSDAVVIRLKPVKGLFCQKDFGPNELKLVPYSPSILLQSPAEDAPASGVHYMPVNITDTTKDVYVLPKISIGGPDQFVVPWWFVRADSGPAVNMHLTHQNIRLHASESSSDSASSNTYKIPVFVNKRAIKAKDEITKPLGSSTNKKLADIPDDMILQKRKNLGGHS